jgi:hypothetical protein
MIEWKIPVYNVIGGVRAVKTIKYDDNKIDETMSKLYDAYNAFVANSGKYPTAVIMNYLDYENVALYTSRLDQTIEMPTEFQGCTILVADNEKLLPEFFLLDAHEQYKKILTEKYSR